MAVDLLAPPPARGHHVPEAPLRRHPGRRRTDPSTRWVVLGALVTVALRLPYVGSALRPDEGGFLMVASQWHPGTSLYGDYWVDRPPLLVAFYAVADWLGGASALRLMGCALAFSVVLLAHQLGRVATGGRTAWPAATALALVVMPFAGTLEVNGELIAVPLVMLGLITALRAAQWDAGRAGLVALWAAAGALGAAAGMVKQNFLDVLVFGAVLLVADGRGRPRADDGRRRSMVGLAALCAGAVAVCGATVLGAWTRGVTPSGLWDALVVFRFEAGGVIAEAASAATDVRLQQLLLVMCLSGSAALILVFVAHSARRWRQPLVVPTMSLLAWEVLGVLGGGSYWLHYLVGLIPGLVLAVTLVASQPGRLGAATRTVVAYAAVVALTTAPAALLMDPPTHHAVPAASWLLRHATAGDTATILYGAPNILQAAGLSSPYPQLWSLPVRVRDPDLEQLEVVLRGSAAPTWLLTSHDLATWGVSAGPAYAVVRERYVVRTTVDGYTVYHLRHSERGVAEPQ